MAPNVTTNNGSLWSFERSNPDDQPLDLTLHRPTLSQLTSSRNFITQDLRPKWVVCKKEFLTPLAAAAGIKSREEKKRKSKIDKAWMKKHVFAITEATFTFCAILNAYTEFCDENNLKPLDNLSLLKMVRSEFTEDVSEVSKEDQDGNEVAVNDEEKYVAATSITNVQHSLKSRSDDKSLRETYRQLTLDGTEHEIQSFNGIKFKTATKSQLDYDEDDSCDSGFESLPQETDSHFEPEVETAEKYEEKPKMSYVATEDLLITAFAVEVDTKRVTSKLQQPGNPRNKIHTTNEESHVATDFETTQNHSDQLKLVSTKSIKRELEPDTTESDSEDRTNTENGRPLDNETTKRSKWSHANIIANVISLLDLTDCQDSPCYEEGKAFCQILIEMMKRKQLPDFLSAFAHSMTCKTKHAGLCFMFKRIIHHVTSTKHRVCAVRTVYGHILRLHLDTCRVDHCGFPKCQILRRARVGMEISGSDAYRSKLVNGPSSYGPTLIKGSGAHGQKLSKKNTTTDGTLIDGSDTSEPTLVKYSATHGPKLTNKSLFAGGALINGSAKHGPKFTKDAFADGTLIKKNSLADGALIIDSSADGMQLINKSFTEKLPLLNNKCSW